MPVPGTRHIPVSFPPISYWPNCSLQKAFFSPVQEGIWVERNYQTGISLFLLRSGWHRGARLPFSPTHTVFYAVCVQEGLGHLALWGRRGGWCHLVQALWVPWQEALALLGWHTRHRAQS